MSRDRSGNGIQEVDGSIPFGSTKPYLPRSNAFVIGLSIFA